VDHRITLNATPAALSLLGDQGYDPDMGARPLRRVIQLKVEDQLSDNLLSGAFVDGDSILVDVGPDGQITLTRVVVPDVAAEIAPEPSV
jgi:ATP-dependent Clp protease ATP-binding subunit ClpA